MMVRQWYAPIQLGSFEDLPAAVQGIHLERCYELAVERVQRVPQQALALRAIGKFHEITESIRHGSIDTLAQVEMIDVPISISAEYVTIPCRNSLIRAGYGRISLVNKGRMPYDLATQFESLNQIQDILERANHVEDTLRRDPMAPTEDHMGTFIELQQYVNGLSAMREKNGFSAYENKVYGGIAMLCSILAATIQSVLMNQNPHTTKGERLLQTLAVTLSLSGILALQDEINSAQGVNRAVYFKTAPLAGEGREIHVI